MALILRTPALTATICLMSLMKTYAVFMLSTASCEEAPVLVIREWL